MSYLPDAFITPSVTTIKTAAYTAAIGETVLCDPTAGGFTVTLPSATGLAGRQIEVKNASASTNAITIATTASQQIEGSPTATIATGRVSLTFRSTGTGWVIV